MIEATEYVRDFNNPAIDREGLDMQADADSAGTRAAAAVGRKLFEGIGAERLANSDDGERWQFDDAVVEFREPAAIAAWVRSGSRGMMYSYTTPGGPWWRPDTTSTRIPGEIDTGHPESDGLVATTSALYRMTQLPRRIDEGMARMVAPVRDRWARARWDPSTQRTKDEISSHYDHDDAFYVGDGSEHGDQGILGDIKLYSSGRVLPGQGRISLEQQQEQKLDSLFAMLSLPEDGRLIEIGSGWGEFALQAAKRNPNLHITSLTVSDRQLAQAQERVRLEGYEDQVEFVGMDYRDFYPGERFDGLVAVEMIEAVDWKDLPKFFADVDRLVHPVTGTAAFQAITVPHHREAKQHRQNGFASKIIFPGGSLVSVPTIVDGMNRNGWSWNEMVNLSSSYPHTLGGWRGNLHDNMPARTARRLANGIPEQRSQSSDRGYDLYLALSETGFRVGNILDFQLGFVRPPR